MTEQTLEPAVPEQTPLERVAQLAAEAAVRARPDLSDRVLALEQSIGEILAALTAAAGPNGNAARLAERLAAVETQLADLANRPPRPDPAQQEHIDNLRLKVAQLERKP